MKKQEKATVETNEDEFTLRSQLKLMSIVLVPTFMVLTILLVLFLIFI